MLHLNLPYGPAIPLLGMCPEDSTSCLTDTCSAMFIAILFTIAKITTYMSHSDKWVTETWCTQTVECYSAVTNNGVFLDCLQCWCPCVFIVGSTIASIFSVTYPSSSDVQWAYGTQSTYLMSMSFLAAPSPGLVPCSTSGVSWLSVFT